MAEIGYARVSTHEQNLDMQHDELHRAGVTTIYEDKASGKTADRPELQHCIKALREGDTLTVWRLDRLGRNLQDLIRIVSDLESRGVTFKSLKETIDTRGPAGKLVFHLFAALAQFERELLRERTLSGLAAARARGFHGGRPQRLCAAQRRSVVALMRDKDVPICEISKQFGVSRSTLYNILARHEKASQPLLSAPGVPVCKPAGTCQPSPHPPREDGSIFNIARNARTVVRTGKCQLEDRLWRALNGAPHASQNRPWQTAPG